MSIKPFTIFIILFFSFSLWGKTEKVHENALIEEILTEHLSKPIEAQVTKCSEEQNFSGKESPLKKATVIEEELAKQIFNFFKEQDFLDFKATDDDCYNRAHIMLMLLKKKKVVQDQKIKGAKIFYEVSKDSTPFKVKSPQGSFIEWKYHVAPVLLVKEEETKEIIPKVFDPSLFDEPVDVQDWLDKIAEEKITLEGKVHKAYRRNRDTYETPNTANYRFTSFEMLTPRSSHLLAKQKGTTLEEESLNSITHYIKSQF